MKIAVAHFRAGLTDGVSLEMDKRRALFEEMGHTVAYIAGNHSGHIDLHIPYFEYKSNPEIQRVQELSFQADAAQEMEELVERIAETIEHQLEDYYKKNPFELFYIHNMFCLPVCLPGTLAFFRFIRNHPEVKTLTLHHDFYWELPRKQLFAFTNPYAQKLLTELFPPQLPNLRHAVINSLAQKDLQNYRSIESEIITDTFDFDQPLWDKNQRNTDYLSDLGLKPSDLMFLIAVRVRERKAVELAIDVMGEITRRKVELVGKKKWDGTEITEDSRIVLLIPGEYTPKEESYVNKLKQKAKELHVELCWIQDWVGSEKEQHAGTKKYALWDCYVYADAVLYTSHWEGWGNQFIEAVFAKKPVVVFEYPVFNSDIKTDGFIVSTLGSEFKIQENGLAVVPPERVSEAATDIMRVLTSPEQYAKIIEHNFAIGTQKYNTNTRLREHITTFINN